MEKTTITKREMYEQIILMFTEDAETEVKVSAEDVVAFCNKEIEALEKKAAKAKERAAVQKAEGDELTDAVLEVLTDEFQPAGDIVKARMLLLIRFPTACVFWLRAARLLRTRLILPLRARRSTC